MSMFEKLILSKGGGGEPPRVLMDYETSSHDDFQDFVYCTGTVPGWKLPSLQPTIRS
jgi:hypothetical protein